MNIIALSNYIYALFYEIQENYSVDCLKYKQSELDIREIVTATYNLKVLWSILVL